MRLLAALLSMLLWMPIAVAAEGDGPPPLPEAAKVDYFVAENGQPVGPLSLQQMQERIQKGETKPGDLVWKTGLVEWAQAQTLPELHQAMQQDGPPPMPRDVEFQRMMIGTWELSYQQEGWVMTTRVSYAADGSYAGALIGNPPGGQPIQMPLTGTWKILPLKGQSFTLSTTNATGETNSTTFRVIDVNTLEDLTTGHFSRKIGM